MLPDTGNTCQGNEKRRKHELKRKMVTILSGYRNFINDYGSPQSGDALEIATGYLLVLVSTKRSIKIHFTGRIVSASDDADNILKKFYPPRKGNRI